MTKTVERKLLAALAAIGLCAMMGGCVADVAGPTAQNGAASHQLRYYGGPKSPMWPAN
jgi:hypothetical protein